MEATLTVPNSDLVREACKQFDRENDVTEKALAELFAAYPANNDPSRVLLKVVALNSLYTTRILAVLKLAHHIADLGAKIDAALASGSREAVTLIPQAGHGDSDLSFYTFATKYCNWHQPNLYPIYDSRVDKYLWALKKQGVFQCEALAGHQDLHEYPQFCVVMTAFREQFGLGSFTFKQIDKFLWSQGQAVWAFAEEEARVDARVEIVADFEEPPPIPEPSPMNAFGGAPAESAEAEVAAASTTQAEDTIPIYQPDSELFKRHDDSVKLFLDMFPTSPKPSADEQPNGRKP
ncbi:MAG TPA: hypothetical protein VGR47_06220 [Terracidiphilus sp.]|nr:hypothetical protein [Terracidiphilus sp.]